MVQRNRERDDLRCHEARRRRRRAVHVVALAAVTLSFVGISNVGAQSPGLVEIPIGTVVRSAPGVATLLGGAPVPEDLVGTSCGVTTRAENNESVHPGNDLVVASGTDSVTLFDVEGSSGKVTTANSPLTLGTDVRITLTMGSDGVFSGGASASVVVDCTPPTTTSTVPTTTSTSLAPTTTSSSLAPTTTIEGPTTTIEGPTTTIEGPTTTIEGPPTPTTLPPEPPTLALTGPTETLAIAIVGILLLDLGYLMFTLRRPAPEGTRRD